MKNKLLFMTGLALAGILTTAPSFSQTTSTEGVEHVHKIKVPKDAPQHVKELIDSLKKEIEAKYRILLAPLEYNKSILSARRQFALDSLKAEEKRALAVLSDSSYQQKEVVKAQFRIQKENIRLQFAQQIAPVQAQIDNLKNQKYAEINALILNYFPELSSDTLHHHHPAKPKPSKDSLDLKGKNSIVTPNPSDGNGTITVNKFYENELLTLVILDTQGDIVNTSSSSNGSFSFTGLKQGSYYYIITQENGKKKSDGKIIVN